MLRTLKIYLADDDHDDVEFFQDALREIAGKFELNISYNGQELLAKLELENAACPDIIFLDINMPKMDGFETLLGIKALLHLKNVPVILYSTSIDSAYIELAYTHGANYYLTKPNSFELLKQKIKKFLDIDWNLNVLPVDLRQFAF